MSGNGYRLDARRATAQARRLQQRFGPSIRVEVRRAHERMAKEVNKAQQEVLLERIARRGREQKGSEALVSALVEDGNRELIGTSGTGGFVAGVDKFLNSSQAAPYWRNLEQGTHIFVGRRMYGFFRSGGSWSPPTNQRRMQTDLRLVYGRDARGNPNNTWVTIQNPIQPYRYLEGGGARFRDAHRAGAIYEQELTSFRRLLQFQTQTGRSRRAARTAQARGEF